MRIVACMIVFMLFASAANAETTTWYGADYAGRLTASGDVYDPSLYTAAHPFLPLGTEITVCDADGDCVDVAVNDVGPVLDLTPAAFAELAPLDVGVIDTTVIVH